MSGVAVSVADGVLSLSSQSLTRYRTAAGSISTTAGAKGTYTPGATTTATIAGCIGPLSDRTRQFLPEGIRLTARYMLHTLADVHGDLPTTTGSIFAGDRIGYNSRTYQVYQDIYWFGHGQYRRFILVEETAEP